MDKDGCHIDNSTGQKHCHTKKPEEEKKEKETITIDKAQLVYNDYYKIVLSVQNVNKEYEIYGLKGIKIKPDQDKSQSIIKEKIAGNKIKLILRDQNTVSVQFFNGKDFIDINTYIKDILKPKKP